MRAKLGGHAAIRLMRDDFGRPDRKSSRMGIGTSVALHAVLITAAVIATNPPEGFVKGLYSLANKVIYYAPPPRAPHSQGSMQQLKYVETAPAGQGVGFERANAPADNADQAKNLTFTKKAGDAGTEEKLAADEMHFPTYDSVFTILEVDSAAKISPFSAAPEYPPALQKLGIEGRVVVRYVVDSMGVPDVSTFKVISSTRPEFAAAVRAALPRMLFEPARMGNKRVAQLVEQPFGFRVQKPDTAGAKKPPA